MGKKETYEMLTQELVIPVLDELHFELVDVEFVKEGSDYYLRIYIDKEGGITINDCETASRKIDPLLDEKDFIDESYVFEVSSPGLGRQLKKEKDFARSIGQKVDVKLFQAMDKRKEFTGILNRFDDKTITVFTEDEEIQVLRSNIAIVKLTIEF